MHSRLYIDRKSVRFRLKHITAESDNFKVFLTKEMFLTVIFYKDINRFLLLILNNGFTIIICCLRKLA